MRWWKQEQSTVLRNRWKFLHGTVYGSGVEDETHRGKEMSEPKKTGSTVTKELSEELPFPANTRGKNSALSSENLVATETTEMSQEAERHRGRQQASVLKNELHQSCFLFPCPHLSLSPVHCPVQDTVHCTWTHFFSSSTSPASSSKDPIGGSSRPPTPLHTQQGGKLGSHRAELHQETQTLLPPAAPASKDSEKMW